MSVGGRCSSCGAAIDFVEREPATDVATTDTGFSNSVSGGLTGSAAISLDRWHHLAYVYDGSQEPTAICYSRWQRVAPQDAPCARGPF